MPWVSIVLGLAALLVITAAIWRCSSLRTAIPCPTWLVELDNPLFRNNGAAFPFPPQ